MENFVNMIQFYQIIIGFAVTIVTYLLTFFKYFKKPIDTLNQRMIMVEESEKAVLTSRIFSICEDALRRGFTTTEEMKNVQAIFKAYSSFGLNGAAKEIYERFLELPLKGVEDE